MVQCVGVYAFNVVLGSRGGSPDPNKNYSLLLEFDWQDVGSSEMRIVPGRMVRAFRC